MGEGAFGWVWYVCVHGCSPELHRLESAKARGLEYGVPGKEPEPRLAQSTSQQKPGAQIAKRGPATKNNTTPVNVEPFASAGPHSGPLRPVQARTEEKPRSALEKVGRGVGTGAL